MIFKTRVFTCQQCEYSSSGSELGSNTLLRGFAPQKVLPTNSLEWWLHSPIHPPQNYRIPSIHTLFCDVTLTLGKKQCILRNIARLTKIGHFSPKVKANLTNIGINLANRGFAGSWYHCCWRVKISTILSWRTSTVHCNWNQAISDEITEKHNWSNLPVLFWKSGIVCQVNYQSIVASTNTSRLVTCLS